MWILLHGRWNIGRDLTLPPSSKGVVIWGSVCVPNQHDSPAAKFSLYHGFSQESEVLIHTPYWYLVPGTYNG